MILTDSELALFAELLDEVAGEEECLLRDRIEAHLYLKGYFERPATVYDDVFDIWIARDGLYETFGRTEWEAITEMRRNQGR